MSSKISDKPWEEFSGADFIDDLKGRNVARAISWLADDFVWHVPGAKEFGGGAYYGVEGLKQFAAVSKRFFPESLERVRQREWHAPGATILEATLEGPAVTGRLYHNDYVFLFVHNTDGKIMEVREYQDIEPLRAVM